MSYLDKAKSVRSQKPSEPEEVATAKKANHANKAPQTLLTPPEGLRNKSSDTLPRLPWQLERLLSAASSDLLPKDAVMLSAGLVTDLNRYALAWGCSYLTGDRAEAERRLWQVYRAWQGVT